ncbi:hypothetical protein JX265_011170 [Neoarthrinium moseri]|uniref:Uncharacterized protein n=1 Tax=Neoarthrinium moseri TaxID=1658444 RepID=A0A9P9WCY8_9PEZI|nr:hypothetical protein JX265_011170 [Neoarthrinium moseri]
MSAFTRDYATGSAPIERATADIHFKLASDDLPPADVAALALVSRTLRSKVPERERKVGESFDQRSTVLPALEREVDRYQRGNGDPDRVYCPWCNILHTPLESLQGHKPIDIQRHCSGIGYKPYKFSEFSLAFHPVVLRALVAYLEKPRGLTLQAHINHLQYLLTARTVANVARKAYIGTSHSARVTQRGLFIRKQRVQVLNFPEVNYRIPICDHAFFDLEPTARGDGNFRLLVDSTNSMGVGLRSHGNVFLQSGDVNTSHPFNSILGCIHCQRDFRIEGVPAAQPERVTDLIPGGRGPFAAIVLTTWMYLGTGESASAIYNLLTNPVSSTQAFNVGMIAQAYDGH